MKRDKLVDCLKGYACFLVVFGHVIMGIRNAGIVCPAYSEKLEMFIWSFHVALFFFLSGYVYNITGEWRRKKTRSRFILYKFINLGIPYIVFSCIYIILNSLISSTNHNNSINDIIWIWKTPVAQYWFLYTLFILFAIWAVLSKILKNWQITILLVIIYYICFFSSISLPFLERGLPYALCFGIGTSLDNLKIKEINNAKKIGLIVLHVLLVNAFIFTNITGKPFIDDIEEVLGIMASIALISLAIERINVKKILMFINRYSLPIYLLHTIFTAGIRTVLMKIGIGNYVVNVVVGIILGIFAPICIAILANKSTVLEIFFYPTKTVEKLRGEKIND